MDANSTIYWHPRTAGIAPSPKTLFVPYDHGRTLSALYGEGGEDARLHMEQQVSEIQAAALLLHASTGKPAVFLRGDHTSAKHAGPSAYRIDAPFSRQQVLDAVSLNVEDADGKSRGEWTQGAWMVREWLDLDSGFGAFGYAPGDNPPPHPIAREWRFFADASGVICHHPYWPEAAIESDLGAEPQQGILREWRAILRHQNRPLSAEDERQLSRWAVAAAAACPDAKSWSVDFACDRSGKWHAIDMAVAAASFHMPDCHRAKDERIVGPRSPKVAAAAVAQ